MVTTGSGLILRKGMFTMKRTICALLTIFTLLSLCACSGKAPENTVLSGEDVAGSKVGVFRNAVSGFFSSESDATVRDFDSQDELLASLKVGSLDCAVIDANEVGSFVKHQHALKVLDDPLVSVGICFAVALENADLTKDINKQLAALTESGLLEKLTDHYFNGGDFVYESPEELDRSAGTLTLAVGADFPPYKTTDESGNPAGLDIDVARAVCDRLGLGLEIVVLKNAGREALLDEVIYGRAHFAAGSVYADEEDESRVGFTDPFAECTQMIVVRKK